MPECDPSVHTITCCQEGGQKDPFVPFFAQHFAWGGPELAISGALVVPTRGGTEIGPERTSTACMGDSCYLSVGCETEQR